MTKTEKMYQMVESWPSSGLSKKEYAQKWGIGSSTLHYWFKSYALRRSVPARERHDVDSAPAFVHVPISQEHSPEVPPVQIVITLASGTRIEVR